MDVKLIVKGQSKSYPSKKALVEALRRILYGHQVNQTIEGEAADLLTAVLSKHHQASTKIGCGIKRHFVAINPEYRNKNFNIERIDGSVTDWSFNEALKPSSNKANVLAALRTSVMDQVLDFKRKSFANPSILKVCPFTGSHLDWSTCHVDHAMPLTFDQLAIDWAKSQKIKLDDIEVMPHGDGECVEHLVDKELEQRWQEYHADNAILRLTSKLGNLSHAKRKV